MSLLRILVTSLVFFIISAFPFSLRGQQSMQNSDQSSKRDSIPGFYKINGKDFFCTENYHKLAEDGNRLKFCQSKLSNCSKINSKNENIIRLCESNKSILSQQLTICESVNSQKDDIINLQKVDNEQLKKENRELRDLSKVEWYESPFLWFGIGFFASIGVGYFYEL